MFPPFFRQVYRSLVPIIAAAVFVPPVAFAQQEVANPGFEQGIQGWVTSPEDAAAKLSQAVAEAAHSGSLGLRVRQEATGPGSWLQSGKVAVDAGAKYQLHFWARAVEESGVGVWIQFYDAERKVIQTSAPVMTQIVPNAKDWKEYTFPFQTPAGAAYATLAVHCFSKRACLADFDDFSIIPPVAAAAPVSTLPFNNPGFEQGIQGWVTSPEDAAAKLSQAVAEAAHSGSLGLRVRQEATGPGSWLQSGKVVVDAGAKYQLHFWARAVEESGVGVWIQFYDADRKVIQTPAPVMTQIVPNAKDWKEYTFPFQTPAGAAYATLAVHCFSKRACLADFDDFSMMPSVTGSSASAAPGLIVPPAAASSGAATPPPVPNLPPPGVARVREIAASLDPVAHGLGPKFSNRAVWDALKSDPVFQKNIPMAERFMNEPPPEITEQAYAESARTIDRKVDGAIDRRRFRMITLILAEGMENSGRFLPAIEREIAAICAEPSWVLPAHAKYTRGNDLGSAMTSWNLAAAVTIAGEKLSASTNKLVRDEVHRRVTATYLEQVHGQKKPEWWSYDANNWNAVVHGGIVGSALALDDNAQERAELIAAAEKELGFYLGNFHDGYCTEGLGYWKYGFGHYVLLAETVLAATHGKVNLYASESARAVAQYPRRLEMAGGYIPSFADCPFDDKPNPWLLHVIGVRYGLGALAPRTLSMGDMYSAFLYAYAVNLSFDPKAAAPFDKGGASTKSGGQRDWFEEAQVLVARPPAGKSGLSLALKGGHNGVGHAHLDLGSYVVAVGGQPVIVDAGGTVYDATTFGPQRFENQVLNSYGHDVPIVAGQSQGPGASYKAAVVAKEFSDQRDSLVLDLIQGYAVASLKNLTRRFDYVRGEGASVTVTDRAEFSAPEPFATSLITYGEAREAAPGVWIITKGAQSLRAEIDAHGAAFTVTDELLKNPARAGKVRRIGISLKEPSAKPEITIKITPAT